MELALLTGRLPALLGVLLTGRLPDEYFRSVLEFLSVSANYTIRNSMLKSDSE